MALRLSDLPPELRRQVLEQAGVAPAAPRPRKPRRAKTAGGMMRICSCLCEIFRPDGDYPERCDGCGGRWPDRSGPL
jgi:hypothetical protein